MTLIRLADFVSFYKSVINVDAKFCSRKVQVSYCLKLEADLLPYAKRETTNPYLRSRLFQCEIPQSDSKAPARSDVRPARTLENVFILEPTRSLRSLERKVAWWVAVGESGKNVELRWTETRTLRGNSRRNNAVQRVKSLYRVLSQRN